MKAETRIYTVSQVNVLIKAALENNLPARLTVTGQITDWKLHHSGHCYFSLKDENSQLPCVMWKSKFSKVKFEPENGLAVRAKGHIDVYPPQGKYQFYVDSMQPAGTGALQLAFEQMVGKLEAQGLFDQAHKKPLPPYPQRIGILTSASGAAVHDITDSIRNRWPCAKLFLYPVPVQGEAAAPEIAEALSNINKRNKKLRLDVLILGRGGGSLEDLWAFNEEVLARAIFNSSIPVISAVGHEVDVTISDLVADVRASTPTKAGVVAVPDARQVLGQLANMQTRLKANAQARLEMSRQNLQTVLASAAFRNPLLPVHNAEQQLDEIQLKLVDSVKEFFVRARRKLSDSYEQIVRLEPHRILAGKTVDLNNLQNRANTAINAIIHRSKIKLTAQANRLAVLNPVGARGLDLSNLQNRVCSGFTAIINKCRVQLTAQANRLAVLNPKSVLKRGYSITTSKKNNRLVKKTGDVELDDYILTELAGENLIESKVTKK